MTVHVVSCLLAWRTSASQEPAHRPQYDESEPVVATRFGTCTRNTWHGDCNLNYDLIAGPLGELKRTLCACRLCKWVMRCSAVEFQHKTRKLWSLFNTKPGSYEVYLTQNRGVMKFRQPEYVTSVNAYRKENDSECCISPQNLTPKEEA